MKRETLREELIELQKLGYIEDVQLKRIEKEYLGDVQPRKNISFLIFALLGVVFIGAGIVSIFAFNWSWFPREIKALIALVLLGTVQVLLYNQWRKGASIVWIESLGLGVGLAYLAALGLIYQAYQLSFSLNSMMLLTFFLMLPVIYLLNLYYLGLFSLGGVLLFSLFNEPIYLLAICFLLPYYVKRIQKEEGHLWFSIGYMIWFLALPFALEAENIGLMIPLILLVMTTIESETFYSTVSRRIIYGGSFIWVLIGVNMSDRAYLEADLLSLMICFGLISLIGYRIKKVEDKGQLLLNSIPVILWGIFSIGLELEYSGIVQGMIWLMNIYILALCIFSIREGIHKEEVGKARKYTFALVVYVLIKVFSMSIGLIPKGILFLIVGIGFLISNYYLSQKLGGCPNEN